MQVFDRELSPHCDSPYVAVAFSQGALYLQLWLSLHPERAPLGQVLLAPALYIRRLGLLELLAKTVPSSWWVRSQAPKALRRFDRLYLWEYRTLFEKARKFQEHPVLLAPTLILVDEKDELVSGKELRKRFGDGVEFLHRPYLRGRRPGKYHILFHPEYFTPDDWDFFIRRIESFLRTVA
jgi:alpha-beta hydrolase superfamily lysophospholipase